MYLSLCVYGLVLIRYVKGVEDVYTNSDDVYNISSENNTKIDENFSSVDDEKSEMIVDLLEEILNSTNDDYYWSSEPTASDVLEEVEAIEEVEASEEVERNSRALTAYPYFPVFTDTYPQYTIVDHFEPYLETELISVPIKKQVPAKGKVTIVGSFTNFNWNVPKTGATNEDEGRIIYSDNIGVDSKLFGDNIYLPNTQYSVNVRLPGVSICDNVYLQNVPFYDGLPVPNGPVSNNGPFYDEVQLLKAPLFEDSIAANKNTRRRIPVSGKLTIAAKFDNCGFR